MKAAIRPALLSALLTLASGCGGQTNAEKMGIAKEVTGKVTMDGQPLSNATVQFVDPKSGHPSIGETDPEGRYRLIFFGNTAGAAPGNKIVRITTGNSGSSDEDEKAGPRIEMVPKRYNTKSELQVDVKPNEPQTFDFDLTSEGDVEQPELETGEDS